MKILVEIDTTLPIPAQLATIARTFIPEHTPTLDDIDTGNPEDSGARDEAHTDAPPDAVPMASDASAFGAGRPAKRPRKVTVPACFDGAPLVAFLRANGPQTIGELCRSLSSAPDVMRASLDAIGAVKTGKAKGTRYSMPATVEG